MNTSVDRIHNRSTLNRRSESVSRFPAPVDVSRKTALESDVEFEASTNHGNILFVYLDDHSPISSNVVASFRAINNDVQTYSDASSCFEFLRSSTDQIFLIISSMNRQLLEDFHNTKSVEAIFIFNYDGQVEGRFPKVYGVYIHLEELLVALSSTLQWFEQTQMEVFVFERDRIFLWSQLWKEEMIRVQKSKVSPATKEKLVQLAEDQYRGNSKFKQIIKEFHQSYVKNDALQWCFFSRFPSTFLHRAFQVHNTEHLQICRFLINDVSRMIQLASRKSSCELYKGMKMSHEFLDQLENHVGQLICPKGFLQCSQSRKTALEVASSLDHRPDLIPVLFKITFDASVALAELHHKDTPPSMVFDVYSVFRLKGVGRGPVTIVKIEAADECGAKLTREYRLKHKKEGVQTLLDQLVPPPKPPVKSAPVPESSSVPEDDDERRANDLLERGDIDQAIAIYQRLKPESARILHLIGKLYAEKKGDYDSALRYLERALHLQEKAGEDETSTLTQLGIVHQNHQDYALALSYHSRALQKLEKMPHTDQVAIANNLIGIANAYWGEKNLTEALNYAQQALTINESVECDNDLSIATNLAILANIYHSAGDSKTAMKTATRALDLFERCVPAGSFALASLINNIAAIQVSERLFTDARHSLDRALEICKKSLPEGHPKRVKMENNIQRMIAMEQKNEQNSQLKS